MSYIIAIAYIVVTLSALFVIAKWRNVPCQGPSPVNTMTMIALLFTAGLDMGLVMLPLTEFPVFAKEAPYQFTNPLAIEFGMWGPLVWSMYFLSAFYFIVFEPKFRVFEIPVIKYIYNLTIIATCAFTCYLFNVNLPTYAPDFPDWARWLLVLIVIGISVYSSGSFVFMKMLAVTSTWGFGILAFSALTVVAYIYTGIGIGGMITQLGDLGGYFANIHRFLVPITEYHEFYLFWWFAWSIMIGQFVAAYVGNLRAWQLAFAMVVLPAIPLGLWFTVLYLYFKHAITIPFWLNMFMIFVGVVFVVNSLDSLIRLYSTNLGISREKIGWAKYYPLNFGLQFLLVLAYQFTPFKIEWVGLVVVGLYVVVYVTILRHIRLVAEAVEDRQQIPSQAAKSALSA